MLGFAFPSSWFQSLKALFIVVFAPLFAWMWVKLGSRQPPSPTKFGIGLIGVALGFILLIPAAQMASAGGRVSPMWLTAVYLVHTFAELCLSPVGLSAMNRLAPSYLASLIMGAWFYMTAVGNFVAGKIGEATGGHGGEMSKEKLLEVYQLFGWISIGAAVAVLLFSPVVKRWMHLDTLKDAEGKDAEGKETEAKDLV